MAWQMIIPGSRHRYMASFASSSGTVVPFFFLTQT
jgi:hypothetical protein